MITSRNRKRTTTSSISRRISTWSFRWCKMLNHRLTGSGKSRAYIAKDVWPKTNSRQKFYKAIIQAFRRWSKTSITKTFPKPLYSWEICSKTWMSGGKLLRSSKKGNRRKIDSSWPRVFFWDGAWATKTCKNIRMLVNMKLMTRRWLKDNKSSTSLNPSIPRLFRKLIWLSVRILLKHRWTKRGPPK